jgi:tetratricopeptide (TPR) repeat protein
MAEFYANQGDPAAALAWQANHPKALREMASQTAGNNPAQAEDMLARAWRADPSDGRTLMRLAILWRKQGQTERADRACELAERLFPADAQVRQQAAQYWLAIGNVRKALQNWDLAMQISPQTAPPLFPLLLNLAKDPAGLALLAPIASAAPSWWQPFFVYAARNATQTSTLRALYALSNTSNSAGQTNAYLARLMRESLWTEAYIVWINALRPEQQQALGYLFDGGFELSTFQGTFDWLASTSKSVHVGTQYTLGVTGRKALHIVLRGRSVPSSIVEQVAFLIPGHYRFTGRVRPDAVQVASGLEWVLECASGAGARLATSERFLGADLWHEFAVRFSVTTESCAGVRLRLQPSGFQTDEVEAKGEIWFDDLAIELAPVPPADLPRGDPPGKIPANPQLKSGKRSIPVKPGT